MKGIKLVDVDTSNAKYRRYWNMRSVFWVNVV